MFAYLQGMRVNWLDMELSRQRKDFTQILSQVMWTPTIFTHAISRTDIPKDKDPAVRTSGALAFAAQVSDTKSCRVKTTQLLHSSQVMWFPTISFKRWFGRDEG